MLLRIYLAAGIYPYSYIGDTQILVQNPVLTVATLYAARRSLAPAYRTST